MPQPVQADAGTDGKQVSTLAVGDIDGLLEQLLSLGSLGPVRNETQYSREPGQLRFPEPFAGVVEQGERCFEGLPRCGNVADPQARLRIDTVEV